MELAEMDIETMQWIKHAWDHLKSNPSIPVSFNN